MENYVRQTSAEAFKKITDNGLLSKRRLQVYAGLFEHGPCTCNELATAIKWPGLAIKNIAARLGELRDSGVIAEIGFTTCAISGHTVINWDVTDKLPLPRQNKIRLDVLLEKQIKHKNALISIGLQIAKERDKDFKKRQTKLF